MTTATFDPSDATAPISMVEGPGVKVGEGTVIHPTFGMETGFVSNVFFSQDPKPAGMLRLMAQVGAASLSEARLDPNAGPDDGAAADDTNAEGVAQNNGSFQYHANVRVAYDQLLSGDEVVRGTGGLGVGAQLRGMVNPMGAFSFGFNEDFSRLIRAANFETNDNTNRDINSLQLTLLVHPNTSNLSGYFYYNNQLDVFESQTDLYPDRMQHRIGAHPMWRILPQTVLYGDFSFGYITSIGNSAGSQAKVDSFPLVTRVGLSTLLTLKLSANISAGYTNGFYSSGPNFSAPVVDAGLQYRYSPLGKVGIAYTLGYYDSVNANYYRDHIIRAFVEQLFSPISILVQPELHLREYTGTTVPGLMGGATRDDTIFSVVAGLHYNFRNWIAATVDYRFSTVQTDFRYDAAAGGMVDPSYVRHELLAGIRVAM